ncbi:predicted protein [Botrytis cinerea T4]|uniref:Uncharacterized protein n=1 Tax=Botryotinia fuckeliana (strain T4) TaxID=999810 RepID=G2XQ68_BOTF4|nr:predicted protein [Botrytis cinerea T4]
MNDTPLPFRVQGFRTDTEESPPHSHPSSSARLSTKYRLRDHKKYSWAQRIVPPKAKDEGQRAQLKD